ncbi:MAG: neutral/alkaline non-lysosomal ceramidase N-terminal domain-containing protein [Planctomycetota bacterium]
MKRIRSLAVVVLFAAMLITPAAAQAELRAGTAVVDITPEQWPLAPRGSFTPRPTDSAHDPLKVRALVLDDGKAGDTTIALVVVDSCMVHRELLGEVKQQASEETGIPVERMLICATHTHSAPFANAQHGTPEELAYQEKLQSGLIEAIVKASKNLQPARAGWSGHDLPDEVFNRRWFLQPGSVPTNPFGEDTDIVKMNPPRNNDILINPAGPTDPEVSVLYIQNSKGRPLSVLANYSLHYVGRTGGEMSADYFGEFARLMPVRLGNCAQDFVAMLSNGTSGDINNINFRNPRPRREPFEQIRIVASKTADAATRAIQKTDSFSQNPTLAMKQREITLNHRVPTPDQIERAKNIVEMNDEEAKELPRLAKAYANRTLRLAAKPPTTKVIIQTVRVGDLAICTLPFEVLVEIGLELKKESPAADTFVVSLANGGYGYLPTPEQHQFGGYETWLTTNKVQKDASEILVDNLLEMLDELF